MTSQLPQPSSSSQLTWYLLPCNHVPVASVRSESSPFLLCGHTICSIPVVSMIIRYWGAPWLDPGFSIPLQPSPPRLFRKGQEFTACLDSQILLQYKLLPSSINPHICMPP
jgi:hypothetical protein